MADISSLNIKTGNARVTFVNGDGANAYHTIKLAESHVMQFTGLTDKNGAEIYEGDYIKRHNYVYEVFYEPMSARFHYKVVGRYRLGRFGVIDPEDGNGQLFSFSPDPYGTLKEVVGNIHENPELI